jgi:3-phytase
MKHTLLFILTLALLACSQQKKLVTADPNALKPAVVTEKVPFDSDDPAIWIHPSDKSQSLIIGTDKETGGGLYAFNLDGKIVRKALGLQRPNNVDIAYGVLLGGQKKDLAIVTERETNKLRFFSLPDMQEQGSGLEVFTGEAARAPMGIAVYTRPSDNASFVVVGRKTGPSGTYLWQYRLVDDKGQPAMELVRKFGAYSGKKEIESIAVDNENGFVYYSDEQAGIHKYHADPAKGNDELAFFGRSDFKADVEGISFYKFPDGTGYIVVSDQQANRFNFYAREGSKTNLNEHMLIISLPFSTQESDGSETSSVSLPGFPGGFFVAMSTDRTFHYYRWPDIAEAAGLRTLNASK